MISDLLNAQESWIIAQESQLMQDMNDLISKRSNTELSIVERLTFLILEHIKANSPISEQFQICHDVLVSRGGKIVYPPRPPKVIPSCNHFHSCYLNQEQMDVWKQLSEEVSTEGFIYEQDLRSLISQSKSYVGSLGNFCSDNVSNATISFPNNWKSSSCDDIFNRVYRKRLLPGSFESTGAMPVDDMLNQLFTFGSYVDFDKRKDMWKLSSSV